MRARLLTVGLLATLTIPTAATAAPLRFKRGFTPHPVVTAQLTARVDDVRVYDRGWKQCDPGGGAFTTQQPILSWDVDEPMPLRIRLENASGDPAGGGGVIVLPDGGYVCDDNKNQFFMRAWPKGHYQLYLTGVSIGVAAIVRIEDPVRSQAELAAAVRALPTVRLGEAGALNPRHEAVPATVAVDTGDAGPTCAKDRQRVMPLARLEVTRTSDWYVASGDRRLFVITADNQCATPTEVVRLPVGTHTLWTIVSPGLYGAAADPVPPTFPLEVDDRAAAMVLPDAPRHEVGALDAPLVLDGTVRPAERWSARRDACRGSARAPDFYLHSDRPLQKVALSLLWAHAPQRLHLMGPLESATATTSPWCSSDDDGRTYDVLEGTYAVWVGGDAAAAGTPFHLLVLRDGVKVDPLTTLAPIPDELSLADRALRNHYPYFRGGPIAVWTALLTTAPDRLFVYTRAPVEADGDRARLPAGEPLLVIFASTDKIHAYRYDGSTVTVDARLIDAVRPAAVVLPTKPALPEVTTLSRAHDFAGPEDAKALATYQKAADRFDACFRRYMERHDPTWGHDHQLYKISGGGRVINVGDQASKAGARACGEPKLLAAERTVLAQLARTRAARFTAHLAAVRHRFGL